MDDTEQNTKAEFDAEHEPRVPVKCKDCIFFKRAASYSKPCAELHRLPNSKPCIRFAPDYKRVDLSSGTPINALFKLLRDVNRDDINLMTVLMMYAKRTIDAGFYPLQPIYFRLYGDDYLANYAMAKIIYADSRKDTVFAQGNGTHAVLKISSVLTTEQWTKKKIKLLTAKKVNDPGNPLAKLSRPTENYEPKVIGKASKLPKRTGKLVKGGSMIDLRG